jgi:hypothetical protein
MIVFFLQDPAEQEIAARIKQDDNDLATPL